MKTHFQIAIIGGGNAGISVAWLGKNRHPFTTVILLVRSLRVMENWYWPNLTIKMNLKKPFLLIKARKDGLCIN